MWGAVEAKISKQISATGEDLNRDVSDDTSSTLNTGSSHTTKLFLIVVTVAKT